MSKPVSRGVYVHIPFCRKKCAYCDFYSRAASASVIDAYVDALVKQISIREDNFSAGSVYFGGGTPSLLSTEQLGRIFCAIEKHRIAKNAEITIEVNPEDVTSEKAKAVKAIGFNRVSVGVQSFDNSELIALGRSHSAEDAEKAVLILGDAFENLSLDLMLGTPAQTELSLETSLSKCKALQPSHISAYLMKVYGNTLFGKKNVQEAGEELSERLYLRTAEFFGELGYEHYEISSYAKPGFYSRHNMLYWQGGEYAAFGSSACGCENGDRYRYENGAEAFISAAGKALRIVEETVTDSSSENDALIFGLRTSSGIFLSALKEEAYAYSRKLAEIGLASVDGDKLRLTERGWLVSNEIITEILMRN